MVKILVVGDLHGVKPKIHFKDFDCIVQPGDFCSDKFLRPMYKKYFKILEKMSAGEEIGFDEFMEALSGDESREDLVQKQMDAGRKVLEYLDSFGVPVFVIPGNWDNSYGKTRIKDMEKSDYHHDATWLDWWLGKRINPYLTKGLKNIKDCQFASHDFRGVRFIGYGNISGPEMFKERLKKRKYTKSQRVKIKSRIQELYGRLRKLFRVSRNKPTVFLSHNIPYGVMDVEQDPKNYAHGEHLGSMVAREMIEKFEPLLCIGGHIHYYHGKKKLGKTTVVNAGFGAKVNTLIDIDEKKGRIRSIKFWDGE